MGAVRGFGSFKDINWKVGIDKIQRQAEEYYGDRDGYSGAANSCCFRYKGEKEGLKGKNLDDFVSNRLDNLSNGEGEIICLGISNYRIYSTTIEEDYSIPLPCYELEDLLKSNEYALIEENIYTERYKILYKGTLAEMKSKADYWLRANKYISKYYIVSKKRKRYCCYGSYKEVKKTTRKNTEKIMVVPVYDFIYYGWYKE